MCAAHADRSRRIIIRVHTHAAGTDNKVCPLCQEILNGLTDRFLIITGEDLSQNLCIELRQLLTYCRAESILNDSLLHFLAGRDDADFLVYVGNQLQQRARCQLLPSQFPSSSSQ